MTIHHTAVWIDHSEAKIFHFHAEAIKHLDVRAPDAHSHVHNRAAASGRREESESFYRDVVHAFAESPEVLIAGPSTAKLALIRHLHRHHPELERRVVGIETVDHPTDRQLVAYARKYFVAADRMR